MRVHHQQCTHIVLKHHTPMQLPTELLLGEIPYNPSSIHLLILSDCFGNQDKSVNTITLQEPAMYAHCVAASHNYLHTNSIAHREIFHGDSILSPLLLLCVCNVCTLHCSITPIPLPTEKYFTNIQSVHSAAALLLLCVHTARNVHTTHIVFQNHTNSIAHQERFHKDSMRVHHQQRTHIGLQHQLSSH